MAKEACILLVEGKSDEEFYGRICKLKGLKATIKVAPPRELGGAFNNKEGVFNLLPALLNQLADGRLQRLAVVVDADHAAEHGLGFQRTLDRVTEIVREFGFARAQRPNVSGVIFRNSDGLHDFGLWVMPDNRSEGMLEHWIKDGIADSEVGLMDAAMRAVGALTDARFKPIHRTKAEVATWLAWQASPGRGMDYAIQEKLIDFNNARFTAFVGWLNHVFS